MRHRRKGRKLGRNPNHQRALLRSLASNLFLTERDVEDLRYIKLESEPLVKGRIITTISKAKEVRPLVEKSITIARRGVVAMEAAEAHGTDAEQGSDPYKSWRASERYAQWNAAMAPAVAARRRCLQLLGDKNAVTVLFEEVAPRFLERPGGYTRILRLATPRLGDNATRAILEFVGVRDRVVEKSEKPAFDDAPEEEETAETEVAEAASEEVSEQPVDESTGEVAEGDAGTDSPEDETK